MSERMLDGTLKLVINFLTYKLATFLCRSIFHVEGGVGLGVQIQNCLIVSSKYLWVWVEQITEL